MGNNKIFINISAKINNFDENYKIAFLDIKERYNVEIFNYYIKWNISDKEIQKLNNSWINMKKYINDDDLLEKIKILKKDNTEYFISTSVENCIIITNEIRKLLGQKISDYPELFRNKRLQRELLLKSKKWVWTNFKKINISNVTFDEIKKEFWLPFVIKPSNWVQSAWVSVIENEENFNKYINNFEKFLVKFSEKANLEELEMIIEEYIDWDKYCIEYYVDENWKINTFSEPTFILWWTDIWIDDLFEFVTISSQNTVKTLNIEKLKDFIIETVKISWIRNSYIHHEFKLTSKNFFKSVELNWRIGWHRTEIYRESSNLNLLDFMFEWKWYITSNNNFATILYYSEEDWILKEFNKTLIEEIKKLKSYFYIWLVEENIWKKVWLTKKWFSRSAKLRFKNSDFKQLEKDIKFIENSYKDLLILK